MVYTYIKAMSYRAGKLFSSGRGHSPPQSPRSHSPRVSACKLAQLPRAVRPAPAEQPTATSGRAEATADRPLVVSRALDSLPPPLAECDLITQIYAAQQDLPLREFASYFNGRTHNNVPPCLTSHEGSSNRIPSVVPLYPTFQQSVKWDPKQPKRNDHQYNCRCLDCQSTHCPGEAASIADRNFRFKNNIMTFCDQHTMTPKVNDVSCGICLGVGMITENKGIETSIYAPKQDMRRKHCNRSPGPACSWVPPGPACTWMPPMTKRFPRHCKAKRERRKTLIHDDCKDYGCRSRRGFPDEAVRDTDPADYCYEQLDENVNCRYPPHGIVPPMVNEEEEQRSSNTTSNAQFSTCPLRKMLYNEGISDDIANNLPFRCRRKEQLHNENSNVSLDWCCPESENVIPYSHRGQSRYHVDCKKTQDQRYRTECEPGDRIMDCPRRYVKKVCYSKCPDPGPFSCTATQHLPRKMLTSEKDVDSFIVCRGDY